MYQERFTFLEETTDKEIMINCRNFKQSLRLSALRSGKSYKVIAIELQEDGHKIDESTLSLCLSDDPAQKKNFPPEAINDFIRRTTDIPLRYLALTNGCGLYRLKSNLEMELEKERSLRKKAQEELETIRQWEKSKK